MPRRRNAVHTDRNAAGSGDFGGHLGARQDAAVAGLGTLAELDLDHLDLDVACIDFKEVGVEAAVRVAAAEVARADLPDQVAAVGAVVLRDRALTRVVRKAAMPGTGVQRQNGIGGQGAKAHGRDVENAGRIGLGAGRLGGRRRFRCSAYPDAKIMRGHHAGLHRMVDPLIALARHIQVRAKRVVVRLRLGALVDQRALGP